MTSRSQPPQAPRPRRHDDVAKQAQPVQSSRPILLHAQDRRGHPTPFSREKELNGLVHLAFQVPASRKGEVDAWIRTGSARRPVDARTHVDLGDASAIEGEASPRPMMAEAISDTRGLRVGHTRVLAELTRAMIPGGTPRAPLYRLTLYLLSGDPHDFAGLAARLARRFGLWLDSRPEHSTAQAVDRAVQADPTGAQAPSGLDRGTEPSVALARMTAACMDQIVPNLAQIAAEAFSAEHVHQARVGLRRLRAMLRLFGSWSPHVDPKWEPALAALFQQLGEQRDRDVLMEAVLPPICAAGAPPIRLPAERDARSPVEVAQDSGHVAVLISLTAFTWLFPSASSGSTEGRARDLRALASAELRRLHAHIRRDAARFAELGDENRHRLRKRIKRLRYCVELAEPVLPSRQVARFLTALRPAQDALGKYTDLLLAESVLAAPAHDNPGASFALGWIAARRPILVASTAKALKHLAAARPPW